MSAPSVRRMRHDLFFVEWGNVRIGGTFSELATFAAELQAEMTKALAGDAEDKRKSKTKYCPKCRLPLNDDHAHRTYEEHDACRNRPVSESPSPVREQPILVCNKCGRRIEAGWSKEDGYFQVGARCYAPFAWSNCDGKLEPQRDAPVREQEGNKMAVLQAYPEARCVAAGWMSGTVHIILQTSDGVKYLSESFPKYHEGHDEECGCNPNWREQGEQEAWEQAAVLLRAKFPNSTVPAQTVREQGEWEKVERVTAEACFKAKGETRYWDYEVVDAEDYDRAVAYIRELERQREVKWNAWLKANQDLARLNTVLADALRIATESCMIFLFNPRPTVQAQVEHFMQQAESKLAASPQEKK